MLQRAAVSFWILDALHPKPQAPKPPLDRRSDSKNMLLEGNRRDKEEKRESPKALKPRTPKALKPGTLASSDLPFFGPPVFCFGDPWARQLSVRSSRAL